MDKQIWWLWDTERAECLKGQDLSKQEERREEYLVVRLQSGLGFAFLSLLYVALRLFLNVQSETSIAEILLLVPPVCWDFGLGVPEQVVSMMPSVYCGGNPKGRHGGGFLSAIKPPAQRKQGGRCWCSSSPHGFHCGSLVTSVTSVCLLHSYGASKRRTGSGHRMYCFLPWWQCPAQVHRDLSVPWVLLAYHLQWVQLLPSVTHLPLGTVTLSIAH